MDNLSQKYLAEVRRLYGDACADASLCEPMGNGDYLIAVAEIRTEHELEKMVACLAAREPKLLDLAVRYERRKER